MNRLRRARIDAWKWLGARPRHISPSTDYDAWLRDGPYHVDALLAALKRDPEYTDFQVPPTDSPTKPSQP